MSTAARVPTAFSSAHRAYVQSLYRRYLRNSLDWNIRRDAWRAEALSIRAAFEKNRNIRNPRELARVLQEAEEKLQKIAHPDPYRREFRKGHGAMPSQREKKLIRVLLAAALFEGGTKWCDRSQSYRQSERETDTLTLSTGSETSHHQCTTRTKRTTDPLEAAASAFSCMLSQPHSSGAMMVKYSLVSEQR